MEQHDVISTSLKQDAAGYGCVAPQLRKSRDGSDGAALSILLCATLLASSLVAMDLMMRKQGLSKKQDQMSRRKTGFLIDYSRLQPDPENSDLFIDWKNKEEFTRSSKVIIAPVIVYLLPEAQQHGIDPEQLAKLAQDFTQSVEEELSGSGRYQIVTERGPGVMELRIALTNVEPTSSKNNAAVKDAATAVSVGVATSTSVLEPSLNVGKLSIEGEILDSVSTQVDVAFMSSNAGRRYFNGLAVSQSWGDIDDAFKSWTRGLCESLDRAHKT